MFVGRHNELNLLEKEYISPDSKLVVLYGRRRVGKTLLVKTFMKNKPKTLSFEAVENEQTVEQIRHFTAFLAEQTGDKIVEEITFSNWRKLFIYLTNHVIKRRSKKKLVLFFDEFQWMSSGRSRLAATIKYFWDNHWKEHNVMLVLCGSVASFMVKKVVRSKALYGRIDLEILLKGLLPFESAQFFDKKRSPEEALKYLLIFGGIPRYLETIDTDTSFNKNINRLCFRKNSLMLHEIEKVFYSQFRSTRLYLEIVKLLNSGIFTMSEIAKKLNIASGGGLKMYLENLELANIINSYIPYNKKITTKVRKYRLADEFIIFFFKYMQPHLRTIDENRSSKLFESLTDESFSIWMGFAFERFCVKHAAFLADILGFGDEVITASPYFERGDRNFQIDLVFKRMDNVITVCEIKYHQDKIGTAIIPQMERKIDLLEIPVGFSVEKVLISLHGPDRHLLASRYFNAFITLKDILAWNQ